MKESEKWCIFKFKDISINIKILILMKDWIFWINKWRFYWFKFFIREEDILVKDLFFNDKGYFDLTRLLVNKFL